MLHILGLIIFTLIGSFAYIVSITLGIFTLPLHMMIIISITAGEILILIVNIITYNISIISFKKGIDPDNVTIPIITSVMDIMGVACLILVLTLMRII